MTGLSIWTGLRELPELDERRMTRVPGLYIAGDLADAPVIKAALRQGAETADVVADALGSPSNADILDVVVVGAGPAGMAAAERLIERGFRVVVLERDAPFQTLDGFPAGKVLYADPPGVSVPGRYQFDDAAKEDIVGAWRARSAGIPVETGVSVTAIDGADGAFTVRAGDRRWVARKVILAVGRRGTQKPLGVPGEERAVRTLDDPARYAHLRVVVVGGGDTAVEWACLLAEAGATVTLLVRGKLTRPKPRNFERLRGSGVDVREGEAVRSIGTSVITDREQYPADAVFAAIGTELPLDLLRTLGIRLRKESIAEKARWLTLVPMVLAVAAFYVLKQGRDVPLLAPIAETLRVSAPFLPTVDGHVRVLDAGFWGTVTYSVVVLVTGFLAMRRHPDRWQKKRLASLVGFQLLFLFLIPELLAPAVLANPGGIYSFSVPWPLSIWSLSHGPGEGGWLLVGAITAFVLVPLFVWRFNESFCSWLCGCGGLAETFGDLWRWRAPRGDLARKAEWAGIAVLGAAALVTGLTLLDSWQLLRPRIRMDQTIGLHDGAVDVPAADSEIRVRSASVDGGRVTVQLEKREGDGWIPGGFSNSVQVGDSWGAPTEIGPGTYTIDADDGPIRLLAKSSALGSAPDFARGWYSLMVDFWLAGVIGVALYPYLGNRVWCRFFCPLRAYMELISKRVGKLAIAANEKCISCGECTRYCQMGIDVQGFAEKGLSFDNRATACIQCGICVEVCPVDALALVEKAPGTLLPAAPIGPRWGV